jgi:hypothetical protein
MGGCPGWSEWLGQSTQYERFLALLPEGQVTAFPGKTWARPGASDPWPGEPDAPTQTLCTQNKTSFLIGSPVDLYAKVFRSF